MTKDRQFQIGKPLTCENQKIFPWRGGEVTRERGRGGDDHHQRENPIQKSASKLGEKAGVGKRSKKDEQHFPSSAAFRLLLPCSA